MSTVSNFVNAVNTSVHNGTINVLSLIGLRYDFTNGQSLK